MKFGIIGTNFISDWFADAANELRKRGEDITLAGIFSRDRERGENFAKKHGILRSYTTLDDMLADGDIDAIYVASPTYKHAEQSIAAMNAGKHVLCEKMMAHALDAFLEMRRCAEEKGLILLEAMRPEFDPVTDILKSNTSKIGAIRRSSFVFCQYSSRYDKFKAGDVQNAFDPKIYNSALADIGIYPLHLAVSLFGKPNKIRSTALFLKNGFLGSGEITLDYGGHISTVSYSKICDSAAPSVIDGENGSLTVDKISAPSRISLKLRGEGEMPLEYAPDKMNMTYEILEFCRLIRENDLEAARRYLGITEICQRICDEVYKEVGAELGE